MAIFAWMRRRQARKDLERIRAMSGQEAVQLLNLCYVAWMTLADVYRLDRDEAILALAEDPYAPAKVSSARIQAAKENAPWPQLHALSVWQTTARAAAKGADPDLVFLCAQIWRELRGARSFDEAVFSEDARNFAEKCRSDLMSLQG
jgi:hypothetical protein